MLPELDLASMSGPSVTVFTGVFKYVGTFSTSQDWKNGQVVLTPQKDKWYLETYQRCNPNKKYRSHEVCQPGVEVQVRSHRLMIYFKDVIFHFKGHNGNAVVTSLEKQVRTILEKMRAKGPLKNRAEVGCNPLLTPNRQALGQRSSLSQRATDSSPARSPALLCKSAPSEQRVPECFLSDISPATSPHQFTSVKENRRSRQESVESESSPDDESKENLHRGLVRPDANQQSWRGDRQPLGIASASFYKGSGQSSMLTQASRARRGCSSYGPLVYRVRPDVPYSWSANRTSTPLISSRQHTPALQGFANIGNTCYMNAILQSLFSLDTLVTDLMSLQKHHGKALSNSSLAYALAKLLSLKRRPQQLESQKLEVLRGVKRAISSSAKRFSGSQQHDAHEFLSQVLDQLKEEVIKVIKDNGEMDTSIVPSVNGASPVGEPALSAPAAVENSALPGSNGKVVSTSPVVNPTSVNFEFEVVHSIECLNCQEQLQKAEQFNDLSLDIPSKRLPGVNLSLQDALDVFLEKEQIEYTCEKCGHKKAEVSHKFIKLPRVLILHLKRYTFDASNSHNSKMRQNVYIPRFITLQDHCDLTTQPHVPVSFIMHNSLVKSPPSSAQRRRKLSFNEERKDDVSPSSKTRRLSDDFDVKGSEKDSTESERKGSDSSRTYEEDLELAIQLSKQESAPRFMEDEMLDMPEDEDEQLKQALALSIKELESGSADHNYTNHGDTNNDSADSFTWIQNPPPMYNSADIAEADLASMTVEEQIQLAINMSLAPGSPHQSSTRPLSPQFVPPPDEAGSMDSKMNYRACTSVSETGVGRPKVSWNCSPPDSASGPFKKPSSSFASDGRGERKHSKFGRSEKSKDWDNVCDDGSYPMVKCPSSETDASGSSQKREKSVEVSYADMLEMDQQVASSIFQKYDTVCSLPGESGLQSSGHSNLLRDDREVGLRNNREMVNSSSSSTDSCNNSVVEPSSITHCGTDTDGVDDRASPDPRGADTMEDVRLGLEGAALEVNGFVSHRVGSIGCISQSQTLKPPVTQENGESEDSDSSLPDLQFDMDDDDVAETMPANRLTILADTKPFPESKLTCRNSLHDNMPPLRKKTPEVDREKGDETLQNSCENTSPEADEPHLKLLAPLQVRTENETTPDRKERKNSAEEKENQSPAVGNGVLQTGPTDKQLEVKIAQHVARATEVEKGNLPFSYRLVSVVNHLGASSNTGHYISDVFDMKKQAWFSYNDSNVQRTSEAEVRNSRSRSGYIFFYLSKDVYDDFCSQVPKGNELAIRP